MSRNRRVDGEYEFGEADDGEEQTQDEPDTIREPKSALVES